MSAPAAIALDPTATAVLVALALLAVVVAASVLCCRRRTRAAREENGAFAAAARAGDGVLPQDSPYVAKVSLAERYGGLQKRSVRPEDLDEETLRLLVRDGKLNADTVERLKKLGKLK